MKVRWLPLLHELTLLVCDCQFGEQLATVTKHDINFPDKTAALLKGFIKVALGVATDQFGEEEEPQEAAQPAHKGSKAVEEAFLRLVGKAPPLDEVQSVFAQLCVQFGARAVFFVAGGP